MNPALKDIVKEELQKLLDAGFIYPISNSEWVSPLVLVPKKNGKWGISVDYRELNKATKKDHFPLPFIDQVLDGLAGKKFFSFLDGFSRIKHRTSTPYHPQENGQAEVIDTTLKGILTNVVSSRRKDWADRLVEATRAYNTTWKTTTGFTPYELVYGKKALLSIEFEYNTLSMAAQLDLDLICSQKDRLL
eukprot:PITA_11850